MIKLLPFILVPLLILAGLGYWRYSVSKQNLITASTIQQEPIEVPKTLPKESLEDRVKTLEDVVTKLVLQVNALKSQGVVKSDSSTLTSSSSDASITELKARVSLLEKATPGSVSSTTAKNPVYIPLGSNSGPWSDQNWNTLNEYEVLINPANYVGYSSMQLEVNFRIIELAGTASVRLYNVSDNTAISSQLDATSTVFGLYTSSTFTLSSGSKTYKLQAKSSAGKDLYIQTARIKVNF